MAPDRRLLQARTRLNRLAIGGWAAQSLFAANELGVFDVLSSGGSMSAAEVAAELGTDQDATRRLLGGLVAVELVEHEGEKFRNGMAAEAYLVRERPESMAGWVSLIGSWNQTFGKLPESVRTGEPAELPEDHLGQSPEYTRQFIIGMHGYAIGPGRELARSLDLAGRSSLLDVGGGPGTYSLLLAEANEGLRCTVWDLPPVVAIAEEVIADHGLSGRVQTTAGDYHADAFPPGHDAILISNTLHQEDWETCVAILRKAYDALPSSGLVVVQAMFLNESGDGPVWPALLNLLLLMIARGGRNYSVGQTFEMLRAAGFGDPEHHTTSVLNAASYVTATRP